MEFEVHFHPFSIIGLHSTHQVVQNTKNVYISNGAKWRQYHLLLCENSYFPHFSGADSEFEVHFQPFSIVGLQSTQQVGQNTKNRVYLKWRKMGAVSPFSLRKIAISHIFKLLISNLRSLFLIILDSLSVQYTPSWL